MKSGALLATAFFLLGSIASADEDARAKFNRERTEAIEKIAMKECFLEHDSTAKAECLVDVRAEALSKIEKLELYTMDEQETITISGSDTVRTITTIRNRSNQKIAEAIERQTRGEWIRFWLTAILGAAGVIILAQ